MPERLIVGMTENMKDVAMAGSVTASVTSWVAEVNGFMTMGIGALTIAFLIMRIVHWVTHWDTPPRKGL